MGPDDAGPEYGPRGYLPERAAKRARKIVLREQMGLHWVVAAAAAAAVVLAAGAAYLLAGTAPPGPPFERVATLTAIDEAGAEVVGDYLVVRAGGPLRVYAAPPVAVTWCAPSNSLESPSGAVWSREGRVLGGRAEPLRRAPAEVHDGVLYVNTDRHQLLPGPTADPVGASPRCASQGSVGQA